MSGRTKEQKCWRCSEELVDIGYGLQCPQNCPREAPTSNERVSDKRLAELVGHYKNADEQHNGWWVAVYWCLRELQERRSAVETTAGQSLQQRFEAWGLQRTLNVDRERSPFTRKQVYANPTMELAWEAVQALVGSPVQPSCTCGSTDGLHEFNCQFRREDDDGKGAVKASENPTWRFTIGTHVRFIDPTLNHCEWVIHRIRAGDHAPCYALHSVDDRTFTHWAFDKDLCEVKANGDHK